ncbi:DedA family protein [Hyphococcus sp.]|uniref:DedA family protein n=1 Tax=Hyphococcus sp. TaxID=2038636 RepID=UPI0035C72870
MSWWVLFGALFLTPFLQEDFGVILAATASLAGTAPTILLVAAILCGLVASDAWKYWMGRLARRYEWAHKFAEKPGVSVAGDLIRKEFLQTMLTARFVPGTRIPTYIAAGFFKAHYPKYVLTLVFTASLYIGVVFSLFHTVGAVAGEEAIVWMPLVTISLLAAYILFRWINHRRRHEGVMTPLTKELDHPMPGMPGFEGTPLEKEEEEEE